MNNKDNPNIQKYSNICLEYPLQSKITNKLLLLIRNKKQTKC